MPDPKGSSGLVSKLAPLISDSSLSAVISTPFDLPWRVIMVADHPGELIESNVITNLAQPCKIADLSWIKPGKTAWDWWSDRVVEGRNFQGGMNTATMKYYIDFAAYAGLEYMLVDASWYGRHDTSVEDITTTIDAIDMPEILRYATGRNVGIWLWVNWECLRDQMDKALPLYKRWGIKGIKVDYMNGDSQEIVNFYWEVCRKAAEYQLMVNFHGAFKPTGLRRTYPNLMTREGVLGLEWSKWSEKCNPDHELTIPYTRMLAGPMDFTPGAFQVASQDSFVAQIARPMAMGTIAHQLAMYVVYESPIQMLVDHPASYFGNPGLNFLKDVPASWSETKFLSGEVGDFIVLARQYEDEWYVGAMTDWNARNIDIPLDFLGSGLYMAQIYQDGKEAARFPAQLNISLQEVTAKDTLHILMAPGGGCAVKFQPTWSP
jgi:alpha-glucosidase